MVKKSWPYPVLDVDGQDYPDCAFQATIELKQTRTHILGKARMDLGSATLEGAVKRGDAQFAVRLHCPRTSFRRIFKSKAETIEFELPEETLRDDFSVQPFLVAERSWELASDEFLPIFKGMKFPVERGFVLAVARPVDFIAEKRLDDLRNIKAIFNVIRNPDPHQKAIDFDFEQDRISIVLAHDDFALYDLFRTRVPYTNLFVCSLVLPALHQALVLLAEETADESQGARWKRVLRRCLSDIGEAKFEKARAFEVAQKLLEMPLARALAVVKTAESER
jgi:hypothetical protein